MPKISVIVPMFNTETYINQCLKSIFEQSYVDFEVLIINDGSTDRSESIALEYVRRDSRFKIYRQSNKGAGAARNKGLEMATGEFIYFLDSDDYIHSSTFEKCIEFFQRNNVEVVMFDAECVIEKNFLEKKIDKSIYVLSKSNYYDRSRIFPSGETIGINDYFKESYFNNKFRANIVLFMFKREVIEINKIRFNELLTYYEDFMFLFELSKYFKCIYYVSEKLYFRRLSGNSLVTKVNHFKMFNDSFYCFNELNNSFNYQTYDSEIKRIFSRNYFQTSVEYWGKCDKVKRESLKIDGTIRLLLDESILIQSLKSKYEEKYNSSIKQLSELIEGRCSSHD